MSSLMKSEERVYYAIRNWIVGGQLLPGTHLVIRSLAKVLETSPTPIVAALRMLERDGLVVNTPGLATQVREWSKQEIIDLYEIRRHHEAMACRLCAERASSSEIEKVVAANERFIATSVAEDVERNLQADIDFHLAVVRGAHCLDLERLVENMAIMHCCMKAYCLSLGISPIVGAATKDVHTPIVEALVKRNKEAAEWAGTRHVEETLAGHLQLIEQVENSENTRTFAEKQSGVKLEF